MSAIAARLSDPTLQARLNSISARYGAEAEDVRQHMTLCLIERAAADETFAEQQIGYLVKCAAWAARHYAEKGRIYTRYVECEPMFLDPEDGELVSELYECWPGPDPTPEQALLTREWLADLTGQVKRLPAKQQAVARRLASGYRPSEIADVLSLSRSSTSHLIERLRLALAQ